MSNYSMKKNPRIAQKLTNDEWKVTNVEEKPSIRNQFLLLLQAHCNKQIENFDYQLEL